VQKPRHLLRHAFWEQALPRLREAGLNRYKDIGPSQDHWLNCATGVSSVSYTLIFSKDEARVEVGMSRFEAAENKWLFDQLHIQKDALEASFGTPLDWLRLDDKKTCRIVCAKPFDGYNRDSWPEMIDWLVERMKRLQETFHGPLSALKPQLQQIGGST
jgi:hypothetical protein